MPDPCERDSPWLVDDGRDGRWCCPVRCSTKVPDPVRFVFDAESPPVPMRGRPADEVPPSCPHRGATLYWAAMQARRRDLLQGALRGRLGVRSMGNPGGQFSNHPPRRWMTGGLSPPDMENCGAPRGSTGTPIRYAVVARLSMAWYDSAPCRHD